MKAALAHLARAFYGTITANPELFLPVACLFVWQVTAVAAKPAAFGLAPLLTLLLLIYGYRVLGKTEWLRRLGWVAPRQGFWFYSLIAGVAAGLGTRRSPERNPGCQRDRFCSISAMTAWDTRKLVFRRRAIASSNLTS